MYITCSNNDDYKIVFVLSYVKFHEKLKIITVPSAMKERFMMTGEDLTWPDLDEKSGPWSRPG